LCGGGGAGLPTPYMLKKKGPVAPRTCTARHEGSTHRHTCTHTKGNIHPIKESLFGKLGMLLTGKELPIGVWACMCTRIHAHAHTYTCTGCTQQRGRRAAHLGLGGDVA